MSHVKTALAAIVSVEEERALLGKIVFLHSTGRCGSTLLSRLMDSIALVQSISECDLYTNIATVKIYHNDVYSEQAQKEILRLATIHLAYSMTLAQPEKTTIAVKHRSFVIGIAKVLQQAIPEAKVISLYAHVKMSTVRPFLMSPPLFFFLYDFQCDAYQSTFLYRDPLPTVDSFCMAFFNNGISRLVRRFGIDSLYLYRVSNMAALFPLLAPLANDARFPQPVIRRLGFVGLTLMSYLSVMDIALTLQAEGFFGACFRYEELTKDPVAVLKFVLPRLGVTNVSVSADVVDAVMKNDAHGGKTRTSTFTGKVKGGADYKFIRASDLSDVNQILSCHKTLDDLHFILPSTFTLSKA